VINGPSGSTLTLAPGYKETGMTVSLSAASITPLLQTGETAMSSAVKISTSGNEPLLAGGSFKLTLPVTGSSPDPSKLMMKVLLTTNVAYPVLGSYDAAARAYSVEVMGLWNGWTFGVVSQPDVGLVEDASVTERESLGWRTPVDWTTCAFRVIRHTTAWSDARLLSDVASPARRACEALRGEGWRSPRLWIDPATNRRIIHVTNDPAQVTCFAPCETMPNAPWCTAGSAAFTTLGLTDAQLLLLGRIYLNVTEATNLAATAAHMTTHSLLIHEMTHSSMFGTDVRQFFYQMPNNSWTYTIAAWSEGGATLLGNTYQHRGNVLGDGSVFVRLLESPQLLDDPADGTEPLGAAYTKQDFLAWIGAKYTGGSLTFLRTLYEALSDATEGRYGLVKEQYRYLYRKGADTSFRQRFGKGLPDVYHEFALDRGYRHSAAARLRTADAGLTANTAALGLFPKVAQWDPSAESTFDVKDVAPLTTRLVQVTLPAALLARPTFDLGVATAGVDLSSSGVRVTVFREDAAGVMLPGGEIAVTDPTQPAKIPMTPPVAKLSIFVSNTSVEDRAATVTIGASGTHMWVGKWVPPGRQGNDCYKPAALFGLPYLQSVFTLDKGTFTADPGFASVLDPRVGYVLTGKGSIQGDTATLQFKASWTDVDENWVPQARIDADVTWYGTRKPVPPESAALGVTDYFDGPSNFVFKTSAPHAPCTTTFSSTGLLVGPCPKPHCAN
jgi:hypothetical protein